MMFRPAGSRVAMTIVAVGALAAWHDLGANAAAAASFACDSALGRVEKLICADAQLSSLDDRLAAAFKKSVDVFGNEAGEETDLVADLRRSQKAWITARDACATPDCVGRLYRMRLDVLEFRGRPGMPAWADSVAGEYRHGDVMTLSIQVRDADSVRLAIAGAEPGAGRWVCDIIGIGVAGEAGGIAVRAADGTNAALLTLRRTAAGFEVPDNRLNQATSTNWCGAGGTFVLSYARK